MYIYGIIALLGIFCIISFFFLPIPAFAAIFAVWLGWSIFALKVLRKRDRIDDFSIFSEMRSNDRRGTFKKYIEGFAVQYDNLEERRKVLEEFSPEYNELADSVLDALNANFSKANRYMIACDYKNTSSVQKYTRKINDIFNENNLMIEKINALIGQLAEIENTADHVSTTNIDDLLEALKEMLPEQTPSTSPGPK